MTQVSPGSPTSEPLHWGSSLQNTSLWETFQTQITIRVIGMSTALQQGERKGIQTLVGVMIRSIFVI